MTTLWLVVGAGVLGAVVVLLWLTRSRPAGPSGLSADVRRIYTTHAKERMELRKISRDEVEAVLAMPDRVEPVEREGSVRFERDFESHVVKVWVAADPWPPEHQVVIKTTAARHWVTMKIPREAVGALIGPGGSTIKGLQQSSNAQIKVHQASVTITADDPAQVVRALQLITDVVKKRRRRG